MTRTFHCECGDHSWSALTRGFVTLVSPEDAGFLDLKWHAFVNQAGNVYASRRSRRGLNGYLHRKIAGSTSGEVDHKNHNGLDNRRQNLRPATKSQNAANRKRLRANSVSSFRGVRHAKRKLRKPWTAAITCHKKQIWIGYFATEIEAAAAYDRKALELFGSYAFLNFAEEAA